MWPKILALAALLLAGPVAQASRLAQMDCAVNGSRATCRLQLEGTVTDQESLYLERVQDRDHLFFGASELGSTGSFLGRAWQAAFLPRVYSLHSLAGLNSPTLTLVADSLGGHVPGIPGRSAAMVIDERFPLHKILAPFFWRLLVAAGVLLLVVLVGLSARRPARDGWIYPVEAHRFFLRSLSVYLLLQQPFAELLVPLLWRHRSQLFVERLALFTMLWALVRLLLSGQFSDRSCIERSGRARPAPWLHHFNDFSFVAALWASAQFSALGHHRGVYLLAIPLPALLLAFGKCVQETEWRRIWKRSSGAPLFFHISLVLLPSGAAAAVGGALYSGKLSFQPLTYLACLTLAAAAHRLRSSAATLEKSRALAADCRRALLLRSGTEDRLQALCNFVAEEWGAARVTILSIDGPQGLVLASAGPEAIPLAQQPEPRRLGPFLRRVCKLRHMLYAPVAEELGQALQNEGLKHSSLAIPLLQELQVRAVFCMMADEGERIPPRDAAELETFVEKLGLEIVSISELQVAIGRYQQLFEIARRSDALAVENLDHWGHFRRADCARARVLLGGDCLPFGPFLPELERSAALSHVWRAFHGEIRQAWLQIAQAFEFIPKDNRDDFWVISPLEFRQPFLQALGAERAALLLATTLERHARALSQKSIYYVLGFPGPRLSLGPVELATTKWHSTSVAVAPADFTALQEIRQAALPGSITFRGELPAPAPELGFSCRAQVAAGRQICSILGVSADKKEQRKIESAALEKIRASARKGA